MTVGDSSTPQEALAAGLRVWCVRWAIPPLKTRETYVSGVSAEAARRLVQSLAPQAHVESVHEYAEDANARAAVNRTPALTPPAPRNRGHPAPSARARRQA